MYSEKIKEAIIDYAIEQEQIFLDKMKSGEKEPIKFIIIGAGNRGVRYANYLYQYGMSISSVVEPDNEVRTLFGDKYEIPQNLRFTSIDDAANYYKNEGHAVDAAINGFLPSSFLPPFRCWLAKASG